MTRLEGKTVIVTGASRGIGRAMALRFAADGANVVIAAKSARPHPKLKGTIYSVAEEVEAAGGKALPVRVDVRHEEEVAKMVAAAVKKFNGIDVLVNNAGAISLTKVEDTTPKRYDLMNAINSRAVFICSRAVLPHLKNSANPHILSLSPPLNFDLKWLRDFGPYTLSKYGMTILSMGMAAEFEPYGIAVNCLWPRTAITTAAIEFVLGGRAMFKRCRKPEILADAACEIVTTEGLELTGRALVDENILRERGYPDLSHYAFDPQHADDLLPDFFLE
jgi:citronellol/citronellal dehydrogenase